MFAFLESIIESRLIFLLFILVTMNICYLHMILNFEKNIRELKAISNP